MKLSRQEILDKLKEVIVSIDDNNKDKIMSSTESSRLIEDIGLTSVGMLYLVIVLEETFDVKFDNVTTTSFDTVGKVIDYIEENI